jgi:hypothetical protein
MELAPYPLVSEQVVKASAGHFPQPFLISKIEELVQRYREGIRLAK